MRALAATVVGLMHEQIDFLEYIIMYIMDSQKIIPEYNGKRVVSRLINDICKQNDALLLEMKVELEKQRLLLLALGYFDKK